MNEYVEYENIPCVLKTAKIYREIECFSTFYKITDEKGKVFISGVNKDGEQEKSKG